MRGAGTSIAGNAVGPGIVVDTSRWLNQVVAIDADRRTARVQPGVVHAALQREARPHGLRFGPDPSTHTRCTIGGMLGNNACGSRALGYGRSVDNVAALRVALADGTVLDLPGAGHEGLAALVDGHLSTVRTEFGRFGRQVSGYSFEHLLPENGRRLDRFLVGSEGTLARGARGRRSRSSRTRRPGRSRCSASRRWPMRPTPYPRCWPTPLVACEGLGHRIVDVVRTHGGHVPDLPPGRAGCSRR